MEKILILQSLDNKSLNKNLDISKREVNVRLNLLDFVPKQIHGKDTVIGVAGDKLHIGNKIKNFSGKIAQTRIRKIDDSENPRLRILRALVQKDMSLEELIKETRLSYDNLRWHILRSKDSLVKTGFVRIKERIFCPHKRGDGGVVKIVLSIIEYGKNQKLDIKQENPRRKELIVVNSNGEEFILSSWWVSWLKPEVENLEFDNSIGRFSYHVPENQILVQYKKSKNIPYSTILPKEVEINDEQFITSLGLLLGEMRTRESDISFSNTEPFLANYVLNSLSYLGITKEDFKFSIQVNTRDFKPKHRYLVEYWSKELGIDKSRLSNIFEYETYGTNRAQAGRIDFICWNIILKEITNNLINYFLVNSENNKEYATFMLRGLLAAEGYVSASTKSGTLDRVAISSCSDYNKDSIKKLLRVLDINSSIRSNCVAISSKENFNKIIEHDLLKVSKDKDKFKEFYSRYKNK